MRVKMGLFSMGAGMLALSLAACSQNSEPEEVAEPLTPVVKEAQTPQPLQPKPVKLAPPRPGKVAPVVAPAFRPVDTSAPFVPSAPGKRISRVNVPGPYVAVTFDDGPSAALTPQVLDIFNRHGARATFFVQGQNASRNRSLLARMAAEGHEVGSHTWSHVNMRTCGTAKLISELDRTAAVIEQATGSRPRVMRPPYGSANANLINMVYNRYGTPAIMWDVDTNDWRKPGVETVIRRAVGNAKPGSIILLHDIHSSTLAAVEGIVTGLQARGFKLVTVSQLIAMGRRAAGATAPAREPEAPAAIPEQPAPAPIAAAPVAEQPAPAVAPAQPQLPEGAASIGAVPAPEPAPEPPPAPQSVEDAPAAAAEENPLEYDDLF